MAGLTMTQRNHGSHAQRPRALPDKVGRLLGLVLAVLDASPAAYGQPASVQIVWNAPAACPSREAVAEEVSRILGHAVAGPVTLARVDVSSDERGRWRAAVSIESHGATSERELEAETCPAIASAVALIVAVADERGLPSEPAPPLLLLRRPCSPHQAKPVLDPLRIEAARRCRRRNRWLSRGENDRRICGRVGRIRRLALHIWPDSIRSHGHGNVLPARPCFRNGRAGRFRLACGRGEGLRRRYGR